MSRRPAPLPATPEDARALRQKVLSDARRELVLQAARSAFLDLGLDGASVREIARRAGYTPGALYSYFQSKEEMYAALLGESLERLQGRIAQALPPAGAAPAERLRSAAQAFFDFYRENPRDLDLGFYLFQGMQPRGLTPGLNEQLNARLRRALEPAQRAMVEAGLSPDEALTELTALFAHTVGLLLLSHTGRIRMFGRESTALFERYLGSLLGRACATE